MNNRSLRALLLALLICTLVPLTPLHARQQAALSLDVQAGYDGAGTYRVGHWFPVTIVAANDGADLNGVLEWRFPGGERPMFRARLDLPRGARKQITLAVVGNELLRNAEVLFLVDDAAQLRQPVRLNPVGADQLALGVVSSAPGTLNSLGALRSPSGGTATVAQIDAARLSGDPLLLLGLDAIFLHDVASADLSEAQRNALREYVALGGTMIVGGGQAAERTVPGFADLLPVEVGAVQANISTQSLAAYAGTSDTQPPDVSANVVTLRPGAVRLDRDGLLSTIPYGDGVIGFAAFELSALRTWSGESALWQQVVDVQSHLFIGTSFRNNTENLLRNTLRLPALQLPSPLLLLALIVVYILVVGPLNFLLLRRVGRIEWAWITTPILVVLFLGAAYGFSFVLRGVRPQLAQLTVVQGVAGDDRGLATAFIGVFSPQRRSYTLRFAPETLVTPGSFEGFRLRSVPVMNDDSGSGFDELLVDVSALRTLMVEQNGVAIPAVSSTLAGNRRSGTVNNTSALTLHDALIVRGDAAQSIGDLPAGGSAAFDLGRDALDFPNQINYNDEGIILRNSVMYQLFGFNRFNQSGIALQADQGIPDQDGVYLLGWVDTPAVEFTIDAAAAVQDGQSLYIIRLQP